MLSVVRTFPKLLMPQSPEDRKFSYPDVLLIEKWLQHGEIISFLNEITGNTFSFDQEVIDFGLTIETWDKEQLPSNNDYLAHPAEQYQIKSSRQVNYSGDILLSYDSPVYPNIYDAIREWCGLTFFHGHGDGRLGGIVIVMPQCRARVEQLASTHDAIEISVKIEDKTLTGLRVKGTWGFSGRVQNFEEPVNGSSVKIERPNAETPEAIAFWLIGPDDRIFDFHRETSFRNTGQSRVLQFNFQKPESIEDTLRAIRAGEGPTVEFKPYIQLDNQKREELVKTVIAFANTSGGVILIGVDDHCIVTGIEKEIAGKDKNYGGKTAEEAYTEYMGKLKQSIAGALNVSVDLEVNKIAIEGHSIILLRVPEGNDKPYYNVYSNEIYVRRGANSVQPNPDYELPELYSKKKKNDGMSLFSD